MPVGAVGENILVMTRTNGDEPTALAAAAVTRPNAVVSCRPDLCRNVGGDEADARLDELLVVAEGSSAETLAVRGRDDGVQYASGTNADEKYPPWLGGDKKERFLAPPTRLDVVAVAVADGLVSDETSDTPSADDGSIPSGAEGEFKISGGAPDACPEADSTGVAGSTVPAECRLNKLPSDSRDSLMR